MTVALTYLLICVGGWLWWDRLLRVVSMVLYHRALARCHAMPLWRATDGPEKLAEIRVILARPFRQAHPAGLLLFPALALWTLWSHLPFWRALWRLPR